MGPDETASNRLDAVFEETERVWMEPIEPYDVHLAQDGRVMEVLSEHLCQGWLEGYLLTGRHGFFSCYEAFIHIVDSMFNQHAKWLKVARHLPWRRPIASLNYLLTSHVWRQDHNGFSHQDPGFVDLVANKKADIVRIYFPPDANTLLWIADHCLRTYNRVNVIVAGKQPAPQWLSMQDAATHCDAGIGIWGWAGTEDAGGEPDVVMACAGDVPTLETLAAVDLLRKALPDLKIRVVNVVDLMTLQPKEQHPHGLSDRDFDSLFTTDKPVIFAYHGYPHLIHRLTYNRTNHAGMHVRGFAEEGTTTTPFDMVVLNEARPLSPRDRGDRARARACGQGRAHQAAVPRQADRAFALCEGIRRGHAGDPGLGLAQQLRRQHPGRSRRLAMADTVLVLNSGSSSIKFGLFDISAAEPGLLCKGLLDEHEAKPRLVVRSPSGEDLFETRKDAADAEGSHLFADVLAFIEERFGQRSLRAVGHRIVHGGSDYSGPMVLTDEIIAKLEALTPLAPLHQPRCLAPVRTLAAIRPALTQIACFDTAFHHSLAPPASRFAIPRRFEARGLRRYGFHGLSFEFVAGRLAAIAPELVAKRTVIAHLGNGASLCALRHGRSVDTTMGLTPLDGLVMGTRSGTIDPGVLLYLQQHEKMSLEDVQHLLYHESGLLGVSGLSADMRTLLASGEAAARRRSISSPSARRKRSR